MAWIGADGEKEGGKVDGVIFIVVIAILLFVLAIAIGG